MKITTLTNKQLVDYLIFLVNGLTLDSVDSNPNKIKRVRKELLARLK